MMYRKGTDEGGTGICRSGMGVRSFSDQNQNLFGFLFLAGLDPHLMSARRGRRSAAAAADRDLRRTRCHANEAAGSGHSTSVWRN